MADPKKFVCNQCGAGFDTREQLRQHIFQQHLGGNKPRQVKEETGNNHPGRAE